MIPEIIFIVPYRDRKQHKFFFDKHIKHILEDLPENTWEIYYSEQNDDRPFNRGAVKNIGFMAMMDKYKNNYQDITFVFNDVDCLPYTKNIIDYKTQRGIIKHFYGFKHLLGGMLSITGHDYKLINGFPNFWTWGYEDNILQSRALKHKLKIDRSVFFKMNDPTILHFYHGSTRQHDITINANKKTNSGIKTIFDLKYKMCNNTIRIDNFFSLGDSIKQINLKEIDITKKDYVNEKIHIKKRCRNRRFHMNFQI
tara:strand:- start:41 stop:802 length:762 start_codon:yes stop_codon:yes gene_type:complete